MTEGSNSPDRGIVGTKRHILTDAKGIPFSVTMSSVEGRSRQKHKKFQIEKNILPEDGRWRETTHGTTGSKSCS